MCYAVNTATDCINRVDNPASLNVCLTCVRLIACSQRNRINKKI